MTLLVVLIVPLVSDRAFSYFPSTSILFISVLLCRTVCSAFFRLTALASSGLFRHSRFPIFLGPPEIVCLHYCSVLSVLFLFGIRLLALLFSLCRAVPAWTLSVGATVQPLWSCFLPGYCLLKLLFGLCQTLVLPGIV